jgi:hypothetical protein
MPSRLFPLIRPAYEDEPGISVASTEARNNAELGEALGRQVALDDEVVDQLRAIELSDSQIERLESSLGEDDAQPTAHAIPPPVLSPPPTGQGSDAAGSTALTKAVPQPPPNPEPQDLPNAAKEEKGKDEEEEEEEEQPRARPFAIFFAIGVALIAAICVVSYIVWDQMNTFKGADRITDLLNSANGLSGDEFEAVQTTTDALKDWFLLKNQHFAVPKEFAQTRTIACRVFQFHNADVGQVMAKDDRELLYFLFDPADLGMNLKKGKWEIVEAERLVGGVTLVEGTCFVVAFRGKHDEMQAYLRTKIAPGTPATH